MGRIKKKHEAGAATQYITRKYACKRLQLSLANFRRLCILKGIYPHEPLHKKKVNKGSTANRTFYFLKDIQFLAHEPIVAKFRAHKTYIKKLKKAVAKGDDSKVDRIRDSKPTYKIDHIVRERYPTFDGAVQDLDDALCMCFLFVNLPKSHSVYAETIALCRRLTVAFMLYVIEARALRKVFISIKGIYFQAEIMGYPVTWITPHSLSHHHPEDVDFKVMSTFTEFYKSMLGFVLFKLYNDMNLHYPPRISITSCGTGEAKVGGGDITVMHRPAKKRKRKYQVDTELQLCSQYEVRTERISSLNTPLARAKVEEDTLVNSEDDVAILSGDSEALASQKIKDDELKNLQNLFKDCKFYLSREVPREVIVFVIRSFGGTVSWDEILGLGFTFSEDEETITHQIIDRPNPDMKYITRRYLQPQWVFDCVNARMILPVTGYLPGDILPPHLSPFVDPKDGYIPPEQERLLAMQRGEDPGIYNDDSSYSEEEGSDDEQLISSDKEDVEGGEVDAHDDSDERQERDNAKKRVATASVKRGQRYFDRKSQPDQVAAEEKRLAVMMMPKKKMYLYKKIKYGERRKTRRDQELADRRRAIDKAGKKKKAKRMKMSE